MEVFLQIGIVSVRKCLLQFCRTSKFVELVFPFHVCNFKQILEYTMYSSANICIHKNVYVLLLKNIFHFMKVNQLFALLVTQQL